MKKYQKKFGGKEKVRIFSSLTLLHLKIVP